MINPISRIFAALFVLAAAAFAAAPASAQEYKLGTLVIEHPWARPSAAETGAAYFVIHNKGDAADALLRVETDAARQAEIHDMMMDGTVMRMRKLDKLEIPAGKSVSVAPGGLHIMLIGLKAPLKAGDEFSARLVFEKAGSVDVSVQVQTPEEKSKDTHGMSGHDAPASDGMGHGDTGHGDTGHGDTGHGDAH
jgi:copper(I)-binding protein